VRPRVFLSFTNRDERDRRLAQFLATGLETRGAKVVKAPENLNRDAMWRPQLADAIKQATHFLVILSAASAGSDEVLDEIRQAKERLSDSGFRMLQIRTGDVKLPDGAQFLNDYQWTPFGDDAAMLDDLSNTLGLRPRVRLAASTQALIDGKTRDFVGRGYVFKEIEEFLATNVSGYFTVIADPGMGKSSVLGEFVRRYGALAHFNMR
jgi:TIR domain